MRKSIIFVPTLLLAACMPPPMPFAGLEEGSYGPLTNNPITLCGQQNLQIIPDSDIDSLHISRGITNALISPLQGSLNPDESIKNADLQDKFQMPADTGRPNVVLLPTKKNKAVFWYVYGLVDPKEIIDAAKTYCGRIPANALYVGSAERCDAGQKIPLTINGRPVDTQSTFVISSFQCVSKSLPTSARHHPLTRSPRNP